MRGAAIVLGFLAATALVSAAVWRVAFVAALEPLEHRAEADLALAADRLGADLQRYKELAVLLADHPLVMALVEDGSDVEGARALLRSRADLTGSRDILVLDAGRRVLASAEGRPGSGADLDDVVSRALDGALGTGRGIEAAPGRRVFRLAAPIFDPEGPVRGAVVVLAGVEAVESALRGARPALFFTDTEGRIFVSSRSELVFRPREGFVEHERDSLAGHDLWRVRGGPYLPERALHLSRTLPVLGLEGEVLADIAPALQVARLQAAVAGAICLGFGMLLAVAARRRQDLARLNRRLEARVARRTAELTALNADLSHQVEERRAAEAQLKKAQADLVQAAKLSALGQMSAGISHELNQPLMAIRSFAENATEFMARDRPDRARDNLVRISDMARRMARIIQNLRAFARQESGPRGRVELGRVIEAALDLTAAQVAEAGVEVTRDLPEAPVWVQGGEVRLGQVFVNLITNAVDAMSACDTRRLEIAVTEGQHVTVAVRDTGPGIEMPDKVFDPFYTTKSTGGETGGMGLGLSISYGIVQSFGGRIRGRNREGGGAEFTVTLERAALEEAAA